MFWGLSEALDLYAEYLKIKPTNLDDASDSHDFLNILLFGASDPRHIIKTIAKRYTHRKPPIINFYIIDGCIEIVARLIALLSISLERGEYMSLRNKVHLFMDVYGNAIMRPISHQYLVGKSKCLMNLITDNELLNNLAPIINIDGLRYRERDGLENAFNFWAPKEGHVFQMEEYWTARNKKLLGARYDHRDGAFDWDLNMTLKDREGKQICSQEYRHWRETGVAFTYPEYEQSKPNKTLCAGLVRNGEVYLNRGYLGDIETGPFCAFGLTTPDTNMLNSSHGINDYRATEITERNLFELFFELENQLPYEHNKDISRKYGATKLLMSKNLLWNENDANDAQIYDKPWIKIGGIKIKFISQYEIYNMQKEEHNNWQNFFDIVFVGHNYFVFLKEPFLKVLKEPGLLILETKLMTVERKNAVNEFEKKLFDYAKAGKLEGVVNYNALNSQNSLLKFKTNLSNETDVENSEIKEATKTEHHDEQKLISEKLVGDIVGAN